MAVTYAALLERKGDLEGARAQLETVVKANPRAVDAELPHERVRRVASDPDPPEVEPVKVPAT